MDPNKDILNAEVIFFKYSVNFLKGPSIKTKVRYLKKDEKVFVLIPLPALLDSKAYAEITEYIQQLNSPILLGVSTVIPSIDLFLLLIVSIFYSFIAHYY